MSTEKGKGGPQCFGWEPSHYFNFPQQLASKLIEHPNRWNFLCHLIGGPLSGVSSVSLVQTLFGDNAAIACTILLSIIAIGNDTMFGLMYAAISVATTYYQLEHLRDLSLMTAFILLNLSFVFTLFFGHYIFEGSLPTDEKAVTKFKNEFYNNFYFVNGVVFGTFHFYSIVCLWCGLRPGLHSDVQSEHAHMKDVYRKAT